MEHRGETHTACNPPSEPAIEARRAHLKKTVFNEETMLDVARKAAEEQRKITNPEVSIHSTGDANYL